MSDRTFSFHDENTELIKAPIDQVFAYLDDPIALAAHMSRSSMMRMGSRMLMEVDAGGSHVVGSQIRMHGSVTSVSLSLEEVVAEHQVPINKAWTTVGTPRLLVLSHLVYDQVVLDERRQRADRHNNKPNP